MNTAKAEIAGHREVLATIEDLLPHKFFFTAPHREKAYQRGLRPRPLGRGYLNVKIRVGGGSFLLQHIITEAVQAKVLIDHAALAPILTSCNSIKPRKTS